MKITLTQELVGLGKFVNNSKDELGEMGVLGYVLFDHTAGLAIATDSGVVVKVPVTGLDKSYLISGDFLNGIPLKTDDEALLDLAISSVTINEKLTITDSTTTALKVDDYPVSYTMASESYNTTMENVVAVNLVLLTKLTALLKKSGNKNATVILKMNGPLLPMAFMSPKNEKEISGLIGVTAAKERETD